MNISATDRSTIAKLLGLIGSVHDAEALNAARKAHELVKAKAATWHDVLGLEAPPPEPEHVAIARELLSKGKTMLTPWEMRFLRGIFAFKTLSVQQQQTLQGIREKVWAELADAVETQPTD